ncbi:MAG TPA: DUF1549 domain-containing protein [Planctomycetota bacterium]|nr:DUF1549 domain-containing protein [Planctomycetota bacterium]
MLALAVALLCQGSPDGPVLLPSEFTLYGSASRQTLLVESRQGGLPSGALRDGVTFTSSDPAIVRIEGGLAVPVANGSAVISATSPDGTSTAKVVVVDMDKPFDHSFRNHVQPILARFGCSSGACHGAAAGKSGFKLSLRGYDDDGDFATITRHALGRRINLEDPGHSLLLLKPTGAVAHKGGVRFDPSSREYAALSEWIAAGAPGPRKEDPRIDHIEIVPPHVVLKPGAEQQILVRAHFSDGTVRDATPWAKYTGSDSTVAVPDDEGRVKVTGNGEGAITAWFLSKIAVATVTVPYGDPIPAGLYRAAPRRNFIDELTLEKLQELRLPPSPPSGDSEFLRRAFLDTIGLLPSIAETRAFLADPAPDKRDRLIDALLARPEFVDYWTHRWGDLLLVSSKRLPAPTMWAYHAWIRNRVAANTPWDQFARQVVTARGGTIENGAGSFFILQEDPTEMAQTASQAFLGMSIQCARCHNHPMEKWTNDQYYAFANLFSRVRAKSGTRAGDTIIFTAPDGELIQPLTNRPRPPQPLDGTPISFDDPRDRREALADWLTSPENPYFSRAIVNRVWANFLGRGLVEAVDDMRKTNPASNEKLLTALADHLAQQKFDLKALMRTILQSQTYQRSSQALPGNAAEKRFYSHYYPRRMMAEVALDALSQVTGAPTEFKQAAERGPGNFAYPVGWRALQLPDTNIDSYFLKSFGRPDRIITCECERTAAPSMSQALHIANGDTLNQKLKAKGNRIETLLAAKTDDATIVDEATLAALCRRASADEQSKLTAILAEAKGEAHREAVEDLYWGILSSKEFLFNH